MYPVVFASVVETAVVVVVVAVDVDVEDDVDGIEVEDDILSFDVNVDVEIKCDAAVDVVDSSAKVELIRIELTNGDESVELVIAVALRICSSK